MSINRNLLSGICGPFSVNAIVSMHKRSILLKTAVEAILPGKKVQKGVCFDYWRNNKKFRPIFFQSGQLHCWFSLGNDYMSIVHKIASLLLRPFQMCIQLSIILATSQQRCQFHHQTIFFQGPTQAENLCTVWGCQMMPIVFTFQNARSDWFLNDHGT